jgi:cytochrome b561
MQNYDKKSIAFHWVSAALVLLLWVIGQTIDWFPKGDPRVMVRSLHITFGASLGIVLFARIYWRRTAGAKLPAADQGIKGKVAIGTHHLLYALMATIVIVGFACVWFRGDSIFGLFKVPAFDPTNRELRKTAVNFHGLLANILLALASLHAGAALWHHFMLKDSVLARMWPALKSRKA